MTFSGLLLEQIAGGVAARIAELEDRDLPVGDVLVRVSHSTINYKDALAIRNRGPVVRSFPMVPGIDFAGRVEASGDPRFVPGDAVLLNGWGVGEERWGGLAQRARVPGDFLLKIPRGLTPATAMAIGTAGYTAMLCIIALERFGVTPGGGDVLVTGASGGVGGIAIALLARLGFRVAASTGRLEETEYLKSLGAAEVIDRAALSSPGKPLQSQRWAAAVDSVGSHTLANVCASLKYRGAVAACGLAQGLDFPATVAPFILRSVSLLGIDSVRVPREERELAWDRLARELDPARLALITTEIPLEDVVAAAERVLAGQVRGRLVVRLPG
jgi:acrylyl-CoA reductase (NADPH)